ncbi:Protein MAK16 [Kalmusia sp. IMI 367209]|nr:Protein MAK16 [Kalmusia sp. IMI 367209]
MASDDLVWSVIGTDFCSFKVKTSTQTFCREKHNVTGFCSRQSCPLANSRYATILAHPEDGTLYLYMKEVERAHLPSKWWSRVKLSSNYTKALAQVDHHLSYWSKFMVHKNKQRLTRLTQIGIRTKKLAKEEARLGERLVPRLAPKVRRREAGRERKAESAAKVERAIERVLLDRLRSGAYGDRPLNVEPGIWDKVLSGLEREGLASVDQDADDGISEDEEEGEQELERTMHTGDVEYVSDVESDFDDLADFEEWLDGNEQDEDEDGSVEDSDEDFDEDSDDAGGEDAAQKGSEVRKLALQTLKRKRSEKASGPKAKRKPASSHKGPRIEIEYEMERAPPVQEALR